MGEMLLIYDILSQQKNTLNDDIFIMFRNFADLISYINFLLNAEIGHLELAYFFYGFWYYLFPFIFLFVLFLFFMLWLEFGEFYIFPEGDLKGGKPGLETLLSSNPIALSPLRLISLQPTELSSPSPAIAGALTDRRPVVFVRASGNWSLSLSLSPTLSLSLPCCLSNHGCILLRARFVSISELEF